MFNNYLYAFISVICLIINVLIQLISFRAYPKKGLLVSIFLGLAIGVFSLFLFEFLFFSRQAVSIREFLGTSIAHFITYIWLGYCYFHFINLGETARRIRILRELREAANGLTMDEIIERRLSRLISNKQIILKDGKYYIGNPLLLWMARILVALKFILVGRVSEFE